MSEFYLDEEHKVLEERAERVRDSFRKMPGFLETLRASQEDEQAGRFVSAEEVQRRWLPGE